LAADAVVGYYSIYCEQIKLWWLENVDHLTLWRLPAFEDFWKKTPKVALRGNFSAPVRVTDLVNALKDTTSLLVCTRKQIFYLGLRVFCEWRHKWRTFRPPWPLCLALCANC